jgi:hypothetical protein
MVSSGMLRRVALIRTDDSEELSTSFIRVTKIGELRPTLAVTSNQRTLRRHTASGVPSSPILVTLMKEALSSSETSVLTSSTRRNISEDTILPGMLIIMILRIIRNLIYVRGTQYRSCFRPYATERKVADSSPDGVIEFLSGYLFLSATLGHGVRSASSRNEYHRPKFENNGFWGVREADNHHV